MKGDMHLIFRILNSGLHAQLITYVTWRPTEKWIDKFDSDVPKGIYYVSFNYDRYESIQNIVESRTPGLFVNELCGKCELFMRYCVCGISDKIIVYAEKNKKTCSSYRKIHCEISPEFIPYRYKYWKNRFCSHCNCTWCPGFWDLYDWGGPVYWSLQETCEPDVFKM